VKNVKWVEIIQYNVRPEVILTNLINLDVLTSTKIPPSIWSFGLLKSGKWVKTAAACTCETKLHGITVLKTTARTCTAVRTSSHKEILHYYNNLLSKELSPRRGLYDSLSHEAYLCQRRGHAPHFKVKKRGQWMAQSGTNRHNYFICLTNALKPSIIRIIKSRRMRWAGHVARMGEKRNAYRLLVGKSERKNN
jgi:hypothetical protein